MIRWLTTRNVRTRLTIWYLMILGVVLTVFSVGIVIVLEQLLDSSLNDSVADRTESLIALIEIRNGDPVLPDSMIIASSFDEFDAEDDDDTSDSVVAQDEEPFARTYNANGEIVSNAGAHPAIPVPENRVARALDGRGSRSTIGSGTNSFRVMVIPLIAEGAVVGAIEVGQPREELVESVNTLINVLVIAVPVTLIVASAGGWFLARRALMPVDEMTEAARRISAEDLSQRLGMNLQDDEFGRLSRTLDDMIERLDVAFQQQRQFTADASHELRTPLAALKGHSEVTLAHPRTAEEYAEALSRIDDEVARLIQLVQRLMVLARADAGQIPIERELIPVNEIIEGAAEQLVSSAERQGVSLKLGSGPDVRLWADTSLMLQLFMNLIDNAIRHTPDGGSITLAWRLVDSQVEIDVQDTGEGVAAEDLPHVFERFYRADRARGRRQGNTGLGLAICDWIARSHGGAITVTSPPGSGACFSVRLPISSSSDAGPNLNGESRS